MIKKISLLGLWFNVGIVFGELTQEKLDAFIDANKRQICTEDASFGIYRAPNKIILKTEKAKKAWRKLLNSNKDSNAVREPTPMKHLLVWESMLCFLDYSRVGTPEELRLVEPLGVVGEERLRVIDFNTIVNGLKSEPQKEEILRLKLQKDLMEVLETWLNASVDDAHYVEIFVSTDKGTKELVNRVRYKLCDPIVETFKRNFKRTLMCVLDQEVGREVFILVKVILSDLKVIIDNGRASVIDERTIGISFENVDDAKIYRLFNHLIHRKLGIIWCDKLTCDLCSKLEEGLFNFLPEIKACTGDIQIKKMYKGALVWVPYPQSKFYKLLQLSLLWGSLEEIWLTIGFANVGNYIFVNKLSDINFCEEPYMFRRSICEKNPAVFPDEPMGISITSKIQIMLKDGKVDSLSPTQDIWGVWTKLQGREKCDYCYHRALFSLCVISKKSCPPPLKKVKIEVAGDK